MFHVSLMCLRILKTRYQAWWHTHKQTYFIDSVLYQYVILGIDQVTALINTQCFLCAYQSCHLTLYGSRVIRCRGPPNLSFQNLDKIWRMYVYAIQKKYVREW